MSKPVIFFVVWIAVIGAWATVMHFTAEPNRFTICPLCGKP